MAPFRVLVVDDSAFMRKIIGDLILQDEQFAIIATASNGIEAVSAAAIHRPDVMTIDLEMPVMNGLEALQLIMKSTPLPIIMLSGISEDNTRDTIKALQYGAFDFIRKPSGAASSDIHQVGEQLREKLRVAVESVKSKQADATGNRNRTEIAAPTTKPKPTLREHPLGPTTGKEKPRRIAEASARKSPAETKRETMSAIPTEDSTGLPKLSDKPVAEAKRASSQRPAKPATAPSKLAKPAAAGTNAPAARKQPESVSFRHIVAIGTSTGGPRALHEVICSLPAGFPAPVLVVQHMPPRFTKSLAQRLDTFSSLKVVEAEHGMRAATGTVYIAPGGHHMELARDSLGYWIKLGDQAQRNGHRPSVDVMFESLAPLTELSRHAVIMTGMGSDGAKGMKLLAECGAASTIAESEETCVVYGMPRSAVEGGFVQSVLPLQQIASRLANAVLK